MKRGTEEIRKLLRPVMHDVRYMSRVKKQPVARYYGRPSPAKEK